MEIDLSPQLDEVVLVTSIYDEATVLLPFRIVKDKLAVGACAASNCELLYQHCNPADDRSDLATLFDQPTSRIEVTVPVMVEAPSFDRALAVVASKPFKVSVEFSFPKGYPHLEDLSWKLLAPDTLLKAERDEVLRSVKEVISANHALPQVLPVVECVRETLSTTRLDVANDEAAAFADNEHDFQRSCDSFASSSVLGRRMIYFHHILSTEKRQCISRWARILGLNGFCKTGYPGLLLVEGAEEACVEYVAGLQRLRWKLMVVRGEERLPCPDGVDSHRCIPIGQGVLETDSSATIADCCRSVGLHDFFLTGMKIYK